MGERTAVRWHGSSFCSIKGRAGHYFGLGSVPTLPAKFTQTEIMPRAVYWLFRVTVHTPLSREVFWHEYAKIPRHTSQNSIAAGNLE